jgi:hypothetical protein
MSTFDEACMSGADFAEMNDFDPYGRAESQTNSAAPATSARIIELSSYGAERFTGPPPPVQWLVEDVFPLGVPAVLAAIGDTGKSFSALNLCYHISSEPVGNLDFNLPTLGGRVAARGTAVFITFEDSEAEVHRRLMVIDPNESRRDRPGKLIVVALPDAGGPLPFFTRDPYQGVRVTDEWHMICDQLTKISDLRLVCFDPLSNFAQVALDKDSGEAQFVASHFGMLSAETGATVLASHHMRKAPEAPKTLSEARDRIRGSSGIVDGVRVAYALWPVDETDGKKVCQTLQIPFVINRVVRGAVVKANGQASREIATYVRADNGLLTDCTAALKTRWPDQGLLLDDLKGAVAAAAIGGRPLQKTGKAGLYERRNELPESLSNLAKHKLEGLCQKLLDKGEIKKCIASGSNAPQWLDVRGGPFDVGEGQFARGGQIVPDGDGS